VAGLFHPHHLTPSTASQWTSLHVVGLFVFPLVGVALAATVGLRNDPVAWLVRVAAFGYATAYTALDVIDGIAAGYVTDRLGPGVPRGDEVNYLFAIGGRLGQVGAWCLVAGCVVVCASHLVRHRVRALATVVLVPGALLVQREHIFAPWGVVGLVLIAVGTAATQISPVRRQPFEGEPRHSG
jgi:hypothetical protein